LIGQNNERIVKKRLPLDPLQLHPGHDAVDLV
jgi:hypothetical protein